MAQSEPAVIAVDPTVYHETGEPSLYFFRFLALEDGSTAERFAYYRTEESCRQGLREYFMHLAEGDVFEIPAD